MGRKGSTRRVSEVWMRRLMNAGALRTPAGRAPFQVWGKVDEYSHGVPAAEPLDCEPAASFGNLLTLLTP